jgi:FkbM family methyltransferase
MNQPKDAVRAAIARFGYRVSAGPPNRFDAMKAALVQLHRMGYAPRVIVDVGANVGSWADMARRVFPDATLHLIEPQAACQPDLAAVCARLGRAYAYTTAATLAGRRVVHMAGAGTGAWIPRHTTDVPTTVVEATSLDALLEGALALGDRALLKIDVEGHELDVLGGAAAILDRFEAIVVETSFYNINGSGNPRVGDVVLRLRDCGFELFDVAALSARPRDNRLRLGDFVFVRRDSTLALDGSWG